MYVHSFMYWHIYLFKNYRNKILKLRRFYYQLSFELKINKIEMSAGQTPTTTAPAPSTAAAPPATSANRTPATTPANRTPATTPGNRSPANAPNINLPTSMQPGPVPAPVPTVTPPSVNVNELITITEVATYDNLLKDVGNKFLLLEFYAPWCGACMLINSKLIELATTYSGKLIIAKVNIDECEQVAIDNNVSMMPSFILLKDSQVLENFAGSNEAKLMSVIQKHLGDPSNGDNGTTTAGSSQPRITHTAQSTPT
ncbi:uncharacterized protein LOC105210630 [Zeugodacus cucurbitae]|uniref:Thioredoxin-2 n=2 Tax=Zeugodacus cucurbitae TaxID=28588 RepID=A0A0A1WPP8_ZEUCU|nr:uncharacterized protein LOC105210630 [Zeugodacus cucurbitae]